MSHYYMARSLEILVIDDNVGDVQYSLGEGVAALACLRGEAHSQDTRSGWSHLRSSRRLRCGSRIRNGHPRG